ncbi:hypothetical protein AVEN_260356-1 [Araneus ventricosus]|uniref:DDE-1 domain-containing protein n=1 Tax=Araneus ventricosus TaxID=182803 RepID=A0A4Y2RIP1_ARAVE|nr:hypothetical protein AVEN_260356-1 [Araneus ventricosus]
MLRRTYYDFFWSQRVTVMVTMDFRRVFEVHFKNIAYIRLIWNVHIVLVFLSPRKVVCWKTLWDCPFTKLGYRKLLLTDIVNDPVYDENLEKTLKNVNLKDAVFSLANCWAFVSTLLINKLWKNLLPNFIDSEVEENVPTEEIQLASLINQLQNTNPMSDTEALQWAAEADDSLARNEISTDNEIIRTVTEEDGDDDDVNPVKISHSEALAALNTSLQWAKEQNFEAYEIMPFRCLRDRSF